MIFSSALFFLVAGTISAVTCTNNTYTKDPSTGLLALAYGTECVRPGKMCEDCLKVVYCVELSGGKFIKEELYDCSSGQTCLNTINDCSVEPNPICDEFAPAYKFVCHQTGTFPDAEDCTKFHMCVSNKIGEAPVNPDPYSGQCDAGFSYDPRTTLCRNKVAFNTTCQPFAPPCSVAGQSGVIPGSLSLYYICLRVNGSGPYFPQMFACPQNQEFLNGTCVDPFPSTPLSETDLCTEKGFFYSKESCLSYYNCAAENVKPVLTKCAAGLRFDYHVNLCTEIKCPDLK